MFDIKQAQNASRLVERWKLGILDDVESTLQRLTRIIEGPNGLLRKINSIESNPDFSWNASNIIRPSLEPEVLCMNLYAPIICKNEKLLRWSNTKKTSD